MEGLVVSQPVDERYDPDKCAHDEEGADEPKQVGKNKGEDRFEHSYRLIRS